MAHDRKTDPGQVLPAFGIALLSVAGAVIAGRYATDAETWKPIILAGTTIVTFLVVFLIQHGQHKRSAELHARLDEILAAAQGANDRMAGIAELDEQELDKLAQYYAGLATRAGARAREARAMDDARAGMRPAAASTTQAGAITRRRALWLGRR